MTMAVKLDVRHLQLVAAVAEEGSVTGAGRRLHLTQSAMSHQLRDAEERLGAQLFLRVNKRMVLTPAGARLLASARRLLVELERAELEIRNMNGAAAGCVRISTECYTCYHWLPPLLKQFQKKFPKVDVRIEAEATRRPVESLLEGKLDVAIISSVPEQRGIETEPLLEDELMVVVHAAHRLAAADYVRPRDLADETVLIYPPRDESTLLNEFLGPAGVEPRGVIEVPLTEAICEMVHAGVGVGFLAEWAVAPYLKSGRLAARRAGSRGFRRTWFIATLRNQPRPEYFAQFIDLLKQAAARRMM